MFLKLISRAFKVLISYVLVFFMVYPHTDMIGSLILCESEATATMFCLCESEATATMF